MRRALGSIASGVLLTIVPLLIGTFLNFKAGSWLEIPLLPCKYALQGFTLLGLGETFGFWPLRYMAVGINVDTLALLTYLSLWLRGRRVPLR